MRFATARNGRFYVLDMMTMSIAEIDNKGNVTPKYKLPKLDGVINGVNDYYGPAGDDDLGARYPETGINFARWVGEKCNVEDIPASPEVRKPDACEVDAWNAAHGTAASDPNGYPAYILNDQRFHIYEFDTYIDNPSAETVSVQFNFINKNTSFFIKEVKFTDLGTDEASATLLGRRHMGWTYPVGGSGVDHIVADGQTIAAPLYYNLQGIRVANPESGIYIVRRGNKVTKEYIR